MTTVAPTLRRLTLLVCFAMFASTSTAQAQLTITSGPDFGTWSIGVVDGVNLTATGGTAPYTWTIVDNGAGGLLPQGLSIRTDLQPWQVGQASATIAGVALTAGDYSFRLQVTDSLGSVATSDVTMRISNLLLQNNWNLPDAGVGVPYSHQLQAIRKNGLSADPVFPAWALQSVSPDAPWLSLSSSGELSGTPPAGQAGNYNAIVVLTEGGETVSRSVNIAVYDVRFTSPQLLPNPTQGTFYLTTVTTDGGTPPYTFTATGLPGGFSITAGGTISGTTTSIGAFRVIITATDASARSRVQYATINIVGSPKALPYFPAPAFLGDATYGWPFSNTLGVSGGGTAPFTYTAAYREAGSTDAPTPGLPAGLNIRAGDDPNGNPFSTHRDAEIWGVPVVLGQYEIFITVTDIDGASMTRMFPLKVGELAMMNVEDSNWTRDVYAQKTLRVVGGPSVPAYGSPAVDGSTLFSVVPVSGAPAPPAGVALATGCTVAMAYCGTPVENLPSFSTRLRFTRTGGLQLDASYSFSVGGGTSTIQITTGSNLGFVLNTQTGTLRTLSACCTTNLFWSIVGGAPPAGLAINASTGALTAASGLSAGTYTFLVQAADNGNLANYGQRLFTLVVTANNITSSTALPYGNVGVAYGPGGVGVQLASTSGGTWSLNYGNLMPPGLTLSPGGLISGTPTYAGQFRFAATVTGGASVTFIVSIYPAGAAPPVGWSFSNQGPWAFGPRTLQLNGASGGSGTGYVYSLAPTSATVPGMRVQNGPPLPTGFSSGTNAGFVGVLTQAGSFPITIRVADQADAGNFIERTATITVSPLHILSQTNLPKARWGVGYTPVALEPTGLVGSALWGATGLPSGMSIDASTGVVSGTPTGGTATATNSVTVTLTDSATLQTISVGFSLVINGNDILPAAGMLPLGTVNSDYNGGAGVLFTTALGCGGSCAWTFSFSGTAPAGLTFNTGTGTLSGTPTGTYNGLLTVTRTDTVLGSVSKIYFLQVVNALPQVLAITAPGATVYGTVGNTLSSILTATGGSGSYTWSLDPGSSALPPGLDIYPAGSAISGTLSPAPHVAGRPMAPGSYPVTLRATDNGTAAFVTTTVTLIVSSLSNSYTTLPLSGSITLGNPYTQELLGLGGSAAEGKGNYSWTANGILPYGLSLTSDGVLSGTPLESGTFSVPIQLSDSLSSPPMVQNVSIAVGGTAVVTFNQNSTSPGTIQQGVSFSQTLTFTGGTSPYTVTATTPLPPGLTLVTGTSRLTGSPTDWFLVGNPTSGGTFTYTLRVQDNAANVNYRTFTITVAPFTLGVATGLPDAAVGHSYSQTLQAWSDAGPVTWSVPSGTSLPPGLSVAGSVLSGTPTLANSSYSFTLQATDASGIRRNTTFTLRVSNTFINGAQFLPVGIIGEPYSHTFTAVGGGAVTWTIGGLPAGFSFSGGILSGTPIGTGQTTVNVTAAPSGGVAHTRRFVFQARFPNPTVMDTGLANTLLADASVGQVVAYNLPFPVGGVPPYTWTLAPGSTLPAGLVLTSASSLGSPIPNLMVSSTGNFNTVPGSTVLFGLPTTEGDYAFDLVATDSAIVPNTVRRTFTLHVSSLSLLAAKGIVTGSAYAHQFTPIGGTAPYTYSWRPVSFVQEPFAPGFTPVTPDGLLQGTTSSTGNYIFFLKVTDADGKTFERRYSINSSNTNWFVSNANPNDVWAGSGRRSLLQLTIAGNGAPTSGVTWSVASGSLPPGVDIWTDPEVTGCDPATGCANGAALAGQPRVPGTYTFTLRATHTPSSVFAEHAYTWRVSPMQIVAPPAGAFVAPNLPLGHKDEPYSTTLKMAGGVAPYHFAPSPFTPFPPGLTLSDSGVLSGIPTSNGSFVFGFTVTDSAPIPNRLESGVLLLIVTPAGVPSPLAFLTTEFRNDASVGVPYAFSGDFLLRGGTAPFTWSLHPGSTLPPGLSVAAGANGVADHIVGIPTTAGDYPFDLDVVDATGQTLTLHVGLTVSTIALTPDTLPPGKVGVPYSATLTLSGGAPPNFFIAHPNWDLPPGLTLSDTGVLSGTPTLPGNFPMIVYAAATGGADQEIFKLYRLAIDNAAGEAPAVSLAPTPIQVFHTVGSPNPAPIPVAVNATTAGFSYTLALEGLDAAHGFGGVASLSSTAGTAPATTNLTLDLSGVGPGVYSGVVAVAASSVNLLDQVPVTITVANPPPCMYSLSSSSDTKDAVGGGTTFGVTAGGGCAWTATADVADTWLHVTGGASGIGPGTVTVTVDPNAGAAARVGHIYVTGSLTYALTQFGSSCSFALSSTQVDAPAAGGSATVNVIASSSDPGCTWAASSADGLGVSPLTAPAPGSGPVEITIPTNPITAPRDLHATIAGIDFVVHQASASCVVSLNPLEGAAPSGGSTGSVSVTTTAGCGYTSSAPGWVTVTSGASGSGSATLVYEVQPNSTTVQRIGTLTIGGQSFQITQEGVPCSVTINTGALGSPYGKDGGFGGSIGVVTNGTNCPWVAGSGAGWAHLSKTSGNTSDTINVTLDGNAGSTSPRSTDLTVAGQVLGITQSGMNCTYSLQLCRGVLPGVGGVGTVGVIAPTGCPWSAVATDDRDPDWLTILSQGSQGTANILFSGVANDSTSIGRSGTLSIRDMDLNVVQTYTVTQAPAPCTYTLPGGTSDTADGGGESKSFTYAATNGCTPTPVSFANWLTNVTADGGTVQYTAQANPTTFQRKGTIQVGDQTFTVTQGSGSCGYSLNAYGVSFNKFGSAYGNFLLAGQSGGACPAQPIVGVTQPFITLLNRTGGPPLQWSQEYGVAPYSSLTATIRKGQITFGGQLFTVKQTSW